MRPDITQSEMALYFDAPPCITVLKEKRVRARFAHRCSVCGGAIAKGERHTYYFIRDDDAIPARAFASRQHLFCPRED